LFVILMSYHSNIQYCGLLWILTDWLWVWAIMPSLHCSLRSESSCPKTVILCKLIPLSIYLSIYLSSALCCCCDVSDYWIEFCDGKQAFNSSIQLLYSRVQGSFLHNIYCTSLCVVRLSIVTQSAIGCYIGPKRMDVICAWGDFWFLVDKIQMATFDGNRNRHTPTGTKDLKRKTTTNKISIYLTGRRDVLELIV